MLREPLPDVDVDDMHSGQERREEQADPKCRQEPCEKTGSEDAEMDLATRFVRGFFRHGGFSRARHTSPVPGRYGPGTVGETNVRWVWAGAASGAGSSQAVEAVMIASRAAATASISPIASIRLRTPFAS